MRREYAYLVIFAAVLFVIRAGTFIVDETQQAIITQFGEPRGEPITEPGLHFKFPFVQKTNYFDKRFLEWDGDADEMPTKDKRFISVDTYARWRITDPLKFFQRLRDERGARSRLDGILDGETRNAIARHDLVEVVRSSNREDVGVPEESEEETAVLERITKGRNDITRSILEAASPKVKDFGIELIDLQFKRISYVEEVQKDVFARMIAERKRIAARYRSEGEGEGEAAPDRRRTGARPPTHSIGSLPIRPGDSRRGRRQGHPGLRRCLQSGSLLLRFHEKHGDLRKGIRPPDDPGPDHQGGSSEISGAS